MINEFVYVAVNENDEIQWVKGSSRKTRYFKTSKYLRGAIEYHNKCYPNDKWTMKMCRLVETADPDWLDETEERQDKINELRQYVDTNVHPLVSPDNYWCYSQLIDMIDDF